MYVDYCLLRNLIFPFPLQAMKVVVYYKTGLYGSNYDALNSQSNEYIALKSRVSH